MQKSRFDNTRGLPLTPWATSKKRQKSGSVTTVTAKRVFP